MKYVFVDDSAQLIGGTSLTLQALSEPRSEEVLQIPTNNLSMMDILSNLDKTWVFGNIHSISKESYQNIIYALSVTRFFKIEFDRLWIHGLVHLFGYDHKKNKDYKRMYKIEKKYFDLVNV